MIFVFGSNLAGRHGKGAALYAQKHHGAEYGVGIGRTGNAFAIPTKDEHIRILPLDSIQRYVNGFIAYARENQGLDFEVTKIGCGLAGYRESDIAPMFQDAPDNCHLPDGWRTVVVFSTEQANMRRFAEENTGRKASLLQGENA